jgi:hypothetical protein
VSGDSGSDIWFYGVQSSQLSQLAAETIPVSERRQPRFSGDGTTLAYFVESADGPTTTRLRTLLTGETFDIDREDEDLFWAADGTLVIVDDEDVTLVRSAGQFATSILLESGLNVISAIATDASGNISAPASPIALTLATGSLADLLIGPQDLFVFPAIPAPGDRVRISATARNAGSVAADGVTVGFFVIDEQGAMTTIGTHALGAIAANGQAAASVDWTAATGRHRVVARVDPFGAITEVSESNNTAERIVDAVAPGVASVRLSLDRTS